MTGDSMAGTKQYGSYILKKAVENKTVSKNLGLIQKNKARLLLIFGIWMLIFIVAYMFIGGKIRQLRHRISETGIAISKTFSTQCGLPLLERNMEALSTILHETTNKSEVLYAAIIDHKNNIMAYTNAELIMPLNKGESARAVERVSYWEGLSADQQQIMSFSTNVTYGGTKIGEIYLALSAAELSYWKDRFYLTILLTCGMFLIAVVVVLFKAQPLENGFSRSQKEPHPHDRVPFGDTTWMTCPLCGCGKTFSLYEAVNHVNLDELICLQSNNDAPLSKVAGQTDVGLSLSKIAERQDMAWLKRQVVYRCTEIIKKLAA